MHGRRSQRKAPVLTVFLSITGLKHKLSAEDTELRAESSLTRQQGLETMWNRNHLNFGVRPPGFRVTGGDIGQVT